MTHNSTLFHNQVADFIDVEAVQALLKIIATLPDSSTEKRKGGYLTILDLKLGIMVSKSFGQIPPEKIGQYLRNSTEKATRLAKFGGVRSYDTRDEGLEHWGGGIKFRSLIIAFSGLPEKLDEALSLIYAIYVQTGGQSEIFNLRRQVGNQLKHYKGNEFIEIVLDKFIKLAIH